jgi:hypothetical protein
LPRYAALVLPRTVNLGSAPFIVGVLSVAGLDNAGFERAVEMCGGLSLSARQSVFVEIYP